MSDDRWMSLPTGRRLEQPEYDPRRVGSVGVLRRADEASLKAARRNMREIPEEGIEGQGLQLTETSTGETWQVVTSLVDLVDPKSSGAEAFAVRDGWLVPLRRIGWTDERDRTLGGGEFYGRKADQREPLPMPSGLEIR